ncbi:MAG: hypothetical protein EP343_02780 [Deltaproteobacteria bacterium]|nr:MAG: hypothetical protein EP343_02780 [Deltaproteobacteria bacterium]
MSTSFSSSFRTTFVRYWPLSFVLFAVMLVRCGEPQTPEDPQPSIYSYANGCYAIEGSDGADVVRYIGPGQNKDQFSFSAETLETATRFHLRASDLGMYLLYDTDRRYFAASGSAEQWTFSRLAKLSSIVDKLDEKYKSPAEWRFQISARNSNRLQLQHYATDRYLTLTGLTSDKEKAVLIKLHRVEGCVSYPEMSLDATGSVKPRKWEDGAVFGIAEIHSHMLTNAGFGGGGIFHGAPFHRLGVEHALPDCTRSHGAEGRNDLLGFFYDQSVKFDLNTLLPIVTNGEVPDFNHHTEGYPKFTEWPNSWRRATHQTMYYKWLERAYLSGLRLLVQHATGNSALCKLTIALNAQLPLYSCNDMVSVDHSLDSIYALEKYIDAQSGGPGKGWLRIVTTPKAAREVINQGKLAVVLGIEISNLFDCFLTPPKGFKACTNETVNAKLDQYYKRGVRVIFPVHKFDNGFSAGDGHRGIIELGNFINSGHYSNFITECEGISTSFDKGDVTFGGLNKPRDSYQAKAPVDMSTFVDDPVGTLLPFLSDIQAPALKGKYCQKTGLTDLGRHLINELMKRGMLMDIAHLPQRSLSEAFKMLEKNKYPATKTHGDSNDGRIYALGGMIGTSLGRCSDPKNPGAMGKRLADDVALAKSKGAYPAEALSFDLNGLAGGPRPRFGKNSRCSGEQGNPITYPFKSYDGEVTFTQPNLGERKVDFNQEGMIHIGLLPELIEDVRRDGVSDKQLEPLFRSAEAYIQMWEKAEARSKELAK